MGSWEQHRDTREAPGWAVLDVQRQSWPSGDVTAVTARSGGRRAGRAGLSSEGHRERMRDEGRQLQHQEVFPGGWALLSALSAAERFGQGPREGCHPCIALLRDATTGRAGPEHPPGQPAAAAGGLGACRGPCPPQTWPCRAPGPASHARPVPWH